MLTSARESRLVFPQYPPALSVVVPLSRTIRRLRHRVRSRPLWRLTALSLVFAVGASAAAGLDDWRGGVATVVVAALWLVSGGLACRARVVAGRGRLGAAQRGALVGKLRELAPLEVRVWAVDQPESIRYARELRNVMHEAAWPAMGVYRSRCGGETIGVALAVRNIVTPPGQARRLFETLRRAGVRIAWAHKPELSDDGRVEILVGSLR
jgi:hypothetical protein